MSPDEVDLLKGFGVAALEVGAAVILAWLTGGGPDSLLGMMRQSWRRRTRPGYGWPTPVRREP